MGQVFLGKAPGGRLVAVKLIRPDLAADPEFRVRFAREVAAARHVGGMFTAAVVDADPNGRQPWLVTAYVPGPSLAAAVAQRGPLPTRSVLTLAAGLAEGLAAIHAAGVIHRDLKPSNVLLADDGPRIIDFGISRASDATALTGAGLVVGSPGFMSPEQAQGQEVGQPSDIFSLGAVLTFAATGDGPFGTGPATTLLYRVVHDQPALGHLPPPTRPLVAECLARDPRQRPTARQLLATLGTAPPRAGWLPWPLASDEWRPAPSGWGPAGVPDEWRPLPARAGRGYAHEGTRRRRPARARSRGRLWAVTALVAALACVAFAAIAFNSPTPAAHPSPTHAAPSPRAVVFAYIAAINSHNWPRVWALGGKNLSPSYHAMVSGYRLTAHDAIISLNVRGDTVYAHLLAHETTGAVQSYRIRYVVRGGVITAGHATLLRRT